MLEIRVEPFEGFDNASQRFYTLNTAQVLKLEHSLISISKWESIHHKAFLDDTVSRTTEEQIDYIRCMTINSGVDPMAYYGISPIQHEEIGRYITNPMTATTITTYGNHRNARNSEFITSELIYYWMVSYRIPWDAEKWHLNRLMTLIEVCAAKNSPDKKMSKSEILAQNKAIRDARRAKAKAKRH